MSSEMERNRGMSERYFENVGRMMFLGRSRALDSIQTMFSFESNDVV